MKQVSVIAAVALCAVLAATAAVSAESGESAACPGRAALYQLKCTHTPPATVSEARLRGLEPAARVDPG